MGKTQKSQSLKKRQGTYVPNREIVLQHLEYAGEYTPFTKSDINLTDNQGKYFMEIIAILVSMGVMREAFLPAITNGAVMWDILVKAKVALDTEGVTQISTKTGFSGPSGALVAYEKAMKQWNSWASSMGLDLKSYGALGIIEAPTDPKQRELEEMMRS